MRFVQIRDRLINLDNVTDISIQEDRVGIETMEVRLRERRIKLTPEETKGFSKWLRDNNLIEDIKPGLVRYPTPDEIMRKIEQQRASSS